ncbi:hypothetical protein CS063_13525 [Sporanaerobium hydrogeniformans]|uniref:Uncharacterized protein n=1 Tax=Sporanaerobium hydrogeniformans TaxID=3072179 RepID=A0AC61D9E4_9FIRM|nr:HD-GYP domain-containing protein [Sporanaerobium hydrogeniformans]PHV69854.1 hypothetical protein CS063_13525 [Sporanaerobium hydrogeniformans]
MRLVEIDKLLGNEIIAKDIVCKSGVVLLKSQSQYRLSYKEKLQEYNISYVYVDDALSQGIEPVSIVDENKRKILTNDLIESINVSKTSLNINMQSIKEIVNSLLEEIAGKNMIYDIMNIKRNDEDIYEHSLGVAITSLILAVKMGLKMELIKDIVMGCLLHDIGKLFVPKEILNKKETLMPHEYEILKEHPQIGYQVIKEDPHLSAVAKVIILCHHEREDGSGYPLKKGEDLHIGAKIVACCDVFNAIVSDRPYRPGVPLNEAVLLLRKERLNQEVRETLESIINFYPVGSAVLLSNRLIGLVEKNYMGDLQRPTLRIVIDGDNYITTPYRFELSKHPEVRIMQKLGNLPPRK